MLITIVIAYNNLSAHKLDITFVYGFSEQVDERSEIPPPPLNESVKHQHHLVNAPCCPLKMLDSYLQF